MGDWCHILGMGFHYEEEHIIGGAIDNRVKGKTVVTIHFSNHNSSLITLQGNPCRDLAGSLWKFRNPEGQMDEVPGAPCFFIPALCGGSVGRISYSRKREVRTLPREEHYDMLFDKTVGDPPTKLAPVLELEWFSEKYGQVEIDCELMKVELVEMAWVMSEEEAAREEVAINGRREEIVRRGEESMEGFYEDMELIEEYLDEDVEPHVLEEECFLIVQEFVINASDESEAKQELHNDLLKLQEQIAGAFAFYNEEGTFDEVSETISLLTGVLPFIDRAVESAKFVAETTAHYLMQLRAGIVALRQELSR